MFLLSAQPETFNSIFFINSHFILGYSFVLVIGLLFLIFSVVFYFICKRNRKSVVEFLIWTLMFFWLLSFVNLFYNSCYDLVDNFNVRNLTVDQQHLKRVYNFERGQGLGYTYYDILNFLPKMKEVIPKGSLVYYIIPFALNPYFYYSNYPDYQPSIILDKVDYLVLYLSQEGYVYNADKHLYRVLDNGYADLGSYDIVKMFDSNRVIFKKINNDN